MAAPSLDASGLTTLTLDEIRENLREGVKAHPDLGPDVPTGPDSALGQLMDPFADQLAETHDLVQVVYDARDPDAAEGTQLDNIAGINGVQREPTTPSVVVLTIDLDTPVVLPAGSRASVEGGAVFATDAEIIGDGSGTQTIGATATVDGPQEAGAGTVTVIVDAVSGWNSVTNAAKAIEGRDVETDSALRTRREFSLNRGGTARAAAIRAVLEALPDVTAAAVLENTTLFTDADGVPAKAYRPIVFPPTGVDEDRVALAIFGVTPLGIEIDGAVVKIITDDQNFAQTIKFSFGTQVEVFAIAELITTSEFPSNGNGLVATALKEFDDRYSLGSKVIPDDLVAFIRSEVPGIENMVLRIKFEASPSATDIVPITPSVSQVPFFDSNITVTP